jgi:hypothetical protein
LAKLVPDVGREHRDQTFPAIVGDPLDEFEAVVDLEPAEHV